MPDSSEHTLVEHGSLCAKFSNWGRWGDTDQLGALNFITTETVAEAAGLVRRGKAFSLAIPLSASGPMTGANAGRFNPIHLMFRSGADAAAGTMVRDFQGGVDKHYRSADDVVTMPLQCGTHWDALSHMFDKGKMFNGVDASWVTSVGALRNDIIPVSGSLVGRGILLDVATHLGKRWLGPGYAISASELTACAESQHVEVKSGDIVLIRTGRMAQMYSEGAWNGFGDPKVPQPGLGLDAIPWLYDRQVAAVAADNLGVEVFPSQIPGAVVPLHIVALVYMGVMLGEIFDLEAIAQDCRSDGCYEFLMVAPPLPFAQAVGGPANPIAIK